MIDSNLNVFSEPEITWSKMPHCFPRAEKRVKAAS